jgi:hypothetical protein
MKCIVCSIKVKNFLEELFHIDSCMVKIEKKIFMGHCDLTKTGKMFSVLLPLLMVLI